MKNYEDLRHTLDSELLQASRLETSQEKQDFVTRTFIRIHQEYQAKQVDHTTYTKLINRLAAYAGGTYNDYLDMLVGAALVGMLDIMLAQQGNLAEEARKRGKIVTDLTGVQPVRPEE